MKSTKLPTRYWFQTDKGWSSSTVSTADVDKTKNPKVYKRILKYKKARQHSIEVMHQHFPETPIVDDMPSQIVERKKAKAKSAVRLKTWAEDNTRTKKSEVA